MPLSWWQTVGATGMGVMGALGSLYCIGTAIRMTRQAQQWRASGETWGFIGRTLWLESVTGERFGRIETLAHGEGPPPPQWPCPLCGNPDPTILQSAQPPCTACGAIGLHLNTCTKADILEALTEPE